MLTNIIVTAIIILIVGCAVAYIIKEKKKGKHCIGCPHGGSCGNSSCPSKNNKSNP